MDSTKVQKIISDVFLEKALRDFYCQGESCKGWETNVITQPKAVKNIVEVGAERISAGIGVGESISDISLARKIDHTLLKPDATVDEIKTLCEEARKHHFASVCVNPGFVTLCAELLKGTDVKVCTVIGFPLGANTTEVKRLEAEQAIANGATEIDMVINIGRLKSGDNNYVFNDVQQVVLAAKKYRVVTKVILETAILTDQEKIAACLICKNAGADFVKTSTGFSKGGATVGDVALMRYVVGSAIGVKASGGIRSREDAQAMVEVGADRIGASASVKIVMGEKSDSAY
ncbi:MAG: deoxyribose-phosphate aldolase [Chlorobiaceae bacterium]|nr:deoxyribose-phosphate aldolase [Chlorobiaceae bacterium]MBA4308919.1 deoxyribose-phosphate aldolase [Chlorobiaceae bacterium]